jgi:PhnB protein
MIQALIPMLCVHDARAAHRFYAEAFGTTVVESWEGEDGRIADSILRIGELEFFVADESPENGALSPRTLGGSSTMVLIKATNADELFTKAAEAGAEVLRPLPQGEGFRVGVLRDPFGHRWMIVPSK